MMTLRHALKLIAQEFDQEIDQEPDQNQGYYRREVGSDGTVTYYNEQGQRHREDGPAIEGADGTKEWYQNGQLHREDGPAVEYADGLKEWWINGQPHRENGPAIEGADGTKAWYQNGQLHRENGPAIEGADGLKEWFQNGQRHREDGPAIERADGLKAWYQNGQRHREDGPAVERADGSKFWFQNGQLHREDGPAIERADGSKEWFQNGQLIKKETPLMDPLRNIYELTYKYQLLKQEAERGDYGLPQTLEDRAYIEFEQLKESLEFWMDSVYDDIINTFEEWLDNHDVNNVYRRVEDMLNRYQNQYPSADLDEKIVLFQEALTTAHHGGEMADHLLNLRDGEGVEFLNELSRGENIADWSQDIEKTLGYEPGSKTPSSGWYQFSKHMKKAIKMLGIYA